jgi:structure-specific endonuclease subunit SLX1
MVDRKIYCYLLRNRFPGHENKIYIGYTVNPINRLRKHNQEIKGGAKYTKKFGNKSWHIYALIEGLPNKINAQQCEWRIKHPDNKIKTNRSYFSPLGRIKGLSRVLKEQKWTNNSTVMNKNIDLKVWISNQYYDILKDCEKDNIKIIPINTTLNNIIDCIEI